MRTPSRWPVRHERDREGTICRRKSAPQYPRGGKRTCERRATASLLARSLAPRRLQAAGLDTASGQPSCLGRRASYSGQPATGVQVQVRAVTTTAGELGVMATKPMSRIGEFGPENTSLTAPVTGPTVPS